MWIHICGAQACEFTCGGFTPATLMPVSSRACGFAPAALMPVSSCVWGFTPVAHGMWFRRRGNHEVPGSAGASGRLVQLQPAGPRGADLCI